MKIATKAEEAGKEKEGRREGAGDGPSPLQGEEHGGADSN